MLSAHRTPDATAEFTRDAADRGLRVIIAGAGGAAHLAGVIAAHTWLPVLGVPMQSKALQGLDSLLVHRANAGRYSGRNLGHRRGGSEKRGATRRRDPGHLRRNYGSGKNSSNSERRQTESVLAARLPV